MTLPLSDFRDDESGAITVDYAVLTASIIALTIAVVAPLATGTIQLAGNVSEEITSAEAESAEAAEAVGEDDEGGGDTASDCPGGPGNGKGNSGVGNQGNDKAVGNAGGC